MERKLEELSDIELKALAYDTLAQLQMFQQNLNVINTELAKRVQAGKVTAQVVPSGVIPRQGLNPIQTA